MTDVCVVDLETWGVGPKAPIIAIGAIKFDPYEVEPTAPKVFRCAIDPSSTLHLFEPDGGTVMWWMKPEQTEARERWLAADKLDLATALAGFVEWYENDGVDETGTPRPPKGNLETYGYGATFDLVIIRNAMKTLMIDCPWTYRYERCLRTLAKLPGVPECPPMPEGMLLHDALSDAANEGLWLKSILLHLGRRG